MFIAALFIMAKKWKQSKCLSIVEWLDKMWYICTMENYLAIKGNEVLLNNTTWINVENIILSERSQSQ